MEAVLPVYQIVLTRERSLDNVEVDIEVNSDLINDKVSGIEEVRNRIATAIEHTLGIRVFVRMMEPNSIPRSEGKAKRVIDKRNM